jgi:tetratricopeptide (TPR) repeat protein
MTQSERIQLSAGVAGALRSFHCERANEIAASLGFLYRTARQPLEALQFFAAAADAARHFAAHSEAAKLARLALEMLEKLPAGPERDARELSVRLLLGAALMATRSYADAEAVTNFTRAGELIGDDKDPQFFPIRLGQWATNIMSSQMLTACRLAEDLVAFAERAEPMRRNVLLSGACMAHGLTLTQMGRFVQSTRQLERAVACDAAANSAGAAMFPLHPGVGSRAQLGLNYWYLGYPDRAVAIGLEGIQEAGDDAYGRAFAQMYLAGVHQLRGEPELVVDLSSRAMAIAEKAEYRYTEVFHWSSIRRGWGIAKLGSFAEGVAQMRESLAANKSNGSKAARAHFMSLMALAGRGAMRHFDLA